MRKIEKQGDHHLRFHVVNNRFCERILRQHKSNHVFYIVDTRSRTYTQGCMDVECRGYWSPDRPVPECCVFAMASTGDNRENESAVHGSDLHPAPPTRILDDDRLTRGGDATGQHSAKPNFAPNNFARAVI